MRTIIVNRSLVVMLQLVFAAAVVVADVPPPPGSSKVVNDLVLRPVGDLSGFRFFVMYWSGDVEEVNLAQGDAATIRGAGAGPRSGAEVWAVPVASVSKGKLDPVALEDLSRRLAKKVVEGQVSLLSYQFSGLVDSSSGGGYGSEEFEISMDNGTGKPIARALEKRGSKNGNESKNNNKNLGSSYRSLSGWIFLGAASLGVVVIILAGVSGLWFFRSRARSKRKTEI